MIIWLYNYIIIWLYCEYYYILSWKYNTILVPEHRLGHGGKLSTQFIELIETEITINEIRKIKHFIMIIKYFN